MKQLTKGRHNRKFCHRNPEVHYVKVANFGWDGDRDGNGGKCLMRFPAAAQSVGARSHCVCSQPFGEDVTQRLLAIYAANFLDGNDNASLQVAIHNVRKSVFADSNLRELLSSAGTTPDQLWRDIYNCQNEKLRILNRMLEAGGSNERVSIVVGDIRESAGWFVQYDNRRIPASFTNSIVNVSINLFNNNAIEAVLSKIYLTIEKEITPPDGTPFASTSALESVPVVRASAEIPKEGERRLTVQIERDQGNLYEKIGRDGSAGQLWIALSSRRPGIFLASVTVEFDVGGKLIETRKTGIEVAFVDAIIRPGQPTRPAPPFVPGDMWWVPSEQNEK